MILPNDGLDVNRKIYIYKIFLKQKSVRGTKGTECHYRQEAGDVLEAHASGASYSFLVSPPPKICRVVTQYKLKPKIILILN